MDRTIRRTARHDRSHLSRWRARLSGLLLIGLLLPLSCAAQLLPISGPTLSLDRAMASPGIKVSATLGKLDTTSAYELHLRSGTGTRTLLRSIPTNSGKLATAFTVPAVAAGGYQVVLYELAGRTDVEKAAVKFRVDPPLSIVPGHAAKAGASLALSVGTLLEGSLQLTYAGRVVYGPAAVAAGTKGLKFVVPTDIPASLPATVKLSATNLVGGKPVRTGTFDLAVAAPRTGSFGSITGVTLSKTSLAPQERFSIKGKLTMLEGSREDVQLQAFWVGSDGSNLPISTRGLVVGADGNFDFDALMPSMGTMSAFQPTVTGQVRVVASYVNEHGRRETEIVDGPQVTPNADLDNDIDIRVTVLRRFSQDGTITTEPLEGAVVVIGPEAPIALFELPPQDPDTTPEGQYGMYSSAHLAVSEYRDHEGNAEFHSINPVNQLTQNLLQFQPPAPACGPSLRRQFTKSDGQVEFVLERVPDSPEFGYSDMASALMAVEQCEVRPGPPDGLPKQYCDAVNPRFHAFEITIYSLHTGAGERDDNYAEVPTRLRVVYDSQDKDFTVTYPNGQVTTHQTSAHINVTVRQIASSQEYLLIGEPWMYSEAPGIGYLDIPRSGNTFGDFVNFSKTSGNVVFEPDVVHRHMRFRHTPGVIGSLAGATLYLQNMAGEHKPIGNFAKQNSIPGCQPDAGDEEWNLDLRQFSHSFRFPDGVFLRPEQTKRCGYIEARNALGHTGRKNVCLQWQNPPEYPGGTVFTVNDFDIGGTVVQGHIETAHQRTDSPAPPPLLGEDLGIGAKRNEGSGFQSVLDVYGLGGRQSGGREFTGDNDAQFSREAGDHDEVVDFNAGSTPVRIGSDEWETIVDVSIPILRWYWGVPELFSAEIFADIRLLAQYYVNGTLRIENGKERLDLVTSGVFAVMILAGFDLDVLFGLFFDAGATIIGTIGSELPVEIVNNELTVNQPCFTFRLDFYGWFDPAPWLPTPVVKINENMLKHKDPEGCGYWNGSPQSAGYGVVKGADPDDRPLVPFEEVRTVFRHPELAFDTAGNGTFVRLDATGALIAEALSGGGVKDGSAHVLSSAQGVRHAKVAWLTDGHALVVWVESALARAAFDAADLETRTRNQRLVWAEWDGRTWSDKTALTAPGTGVAHVALAACDGGRTACPSGGRVTAVWQDRNLTVSPVVSTLKWADFTSAGGWSAVNKVATPPSGHHDLTPTVTVLSNAEPLVAWIRAPHWIGTRTVNLAALNERQLMYRMLYTGNAALVNANAPHRVSMPSLLAGTSRTAKLVFTRADNSTGFIGTRQALYLAQAACGSTGTCTWTWKRAADDRGRAIYGERPRLLPDRDNGVQVVMRAFRFGAANEGRPIAANDPLGTVLVSGDLLAIRGDFVTGKVRHVALTADGAMHMSPAAAFDAANQTVFAVSSVRVPDMPAPIGAVVKALGAQTVRGFATSKAIDDGLELHNAASTPDLGIEGLLTAAAIPDGGGQPIQVTVDVFNRGSDYVPATHGAGQLALHWSNPVPGTSAWRMTLPALAAGSSQRIVVDLDVPVDFTAEEAHLLYATLTMSSDIGDMDGENNQVVHAFDGLPVPQGVRSEILPGAPFVQLTWPMPEDARVEGFVVYVDEADGSQHVLGSTGTNGFLDLSAQFEAARTYRVASYSARGIESEKSEPVTAHSLPAGREPLLSDGFEDPVP